MTLMAATNVHVAFGATSVLEGVDATLAKGELVGLIGPNGAGKTTLVRALAGLQRVDSGTIAFDGVPISEVKRGALAQRLAYLAQGSEIHWPLTVERLAALGRLPHLGPFERPGAGDRAAISRALAAADVSHLAARRATTLSGGERLRALVARALAVEPEAYLADEPVAALDPRHQLDLMTLLRRLAEDGAAVLVVLHELSLAARFCHRLVLLHEARVLAEGPPEAVLSPATLKTAYGVEAIIGRRDDGLYVLPWRIVDGTAGIGRDRVRTDRGEGP